MDTSKFKTKSEIIERKMPRINGNNQYKGRTIIAIDGGYSSVKGVGPERVFMFPSYAKKAPSSLEVVGKIDECDILFRNNNTGETWLVGQSAETMMDQTDHESITDASLFTRYRYDSDMYKVIMATGLALGLWNTPKGNEVYLQTGLPSAYKKADAPKLISALAGKYNISIKVGARPWSDFEFVLPPNNINVMEQPMGTLCSIAYSNGERTKFGDEVMASNSLILDIGFGTEDIFSVRRGYSSESKTYSDTAMRAVFDDVIKEIKKDYPDVELKVFELQNHLVDGQAPYFDISEFKMNYIPFGDILAKVNADLCEKSIMRLMQDYQNMQNYKYLIVTGGTGESRFNQIKSKLSVIPSLQVLPGNMNVPDLSYQYSNVVGYYMLRHALTVRDAKLAEKNNA